MIGTQLFAEFNWKIISYSVSDTVTSDGEDKMRKWRKLYSLKEDTEPRVWTANCLVRIRTCQRKVVEAGLSRGRRHTSMQIQQSSGHQARTPEQILPIRVVSHQAELAKTLTLSWWVSRCILHKAASPFSKGDLGSTSSCLPQEGSMVILKYTQLTIIFFLRWGRLPEHPLSITHSANTYCYVTVWQAGTRHSGYKSKAGWRIETLP